MSTTILKPAFVFTCSACGSETFVKAVPAELDAEERAEVVARGLTTEPGYWVKSPLVVQCGRCSRVYHVEAEANDT